MTNVLVIGSSGQLGLSIQSVAYKYTDLRLKYTNSQELDITDREKLEQYFKHHDFEYCVNCAAYTAVDQAEIETEHAKRINSLGPSYLAELCAKYNAILVHISTDFVFDGNSQTPYSETEQPNPLNCYGQTKLDGEKVIKAILENHFIIRTSWLYSEFNQNFFKTMLKHGSVKEELSVVNDQFGSPTYAPDLAHAILKIIQSKSKAFGTYHFSNTGGISWFQFAKTIFEYSGLKTKVIPVSTAYYQTRAKRPKYSVMDTSKIESTFNLEIPEYKSSLRKAVERLQDLNYQTAVKASIKAGEAIMDVYDGEFGVELKADDSPLTLADRNANEVINALLKATPFPIISEENKQIDYAVRKKWSCYWLVDPLDGTKEFVKRNGEFTVNIALIKYGKPQFGVIYVPVTKVLYVADVSENRVYKHQLTTHQMPSNLFEKNSRLTRKSSESDHIRVVGSRSHMNEETTAFIRDLEANNHNVEIVSKGSSLKFCIIAEGLADIYPRFGPTMEWDTGAGQALCEAMGASVISSETNEPLGYNKENLLNPYFKVSF